MSNIFKKNVRKLFSFYQITRKLDKNASEEVNHVKVIMTLVGKMFIDKWHHTIFLFTIWFFFKESIKNCCYFKNLSFAVVFLDFFRQLLNYVLCILPLFMFFRLSRSRWIQKYYYYLNHYFVAIDYVNSIFCRKYKSVKKEGRKNCILHIYDCYLNIYTKNQFSK